MLPPLNPIIPQKHLEPFSTMSIDLITKLPASRGFNLILTITNQGCTKAAILIPCQEAMPLLHLFHTRRARTLASAFDPHRPPSTPVALSDRATPAASSCRGHSFSAWRLGTFTIGRCIFTSAIFFLCLHRVCVLHDRVPKRVERVRHSRHRTEERAG